MKEIKIQISSCLKLSVAGGMVCNRAMEQKESIADDLSVLYLIVLMGIYLLMGIDTTKINQVGCSILYINLKQTFKK